MDNYYKASGPPSPSLLRNATSPSGRGKSSTATFLALPLGELDAKRPEMARTFIPFINENRGACKYRLPYIGVSNAFEI